MQQGQGAPQFASLYVGDLDNEVTEAMLYEIFNTVGPVASIRVCRDSVSRRSLGYAYVNFHSAADAERVMDTLNYSTIKGRCCRIMWSHRDPNLRKTGNGNVFVKNLDKNVDNKALYDTFSLFGNILSCKVATDSEGKTRGYGFVHYETAEAAKQAIEKVNGMQIGEKTVFVGEFIPRDSRETREVTNFTNIYLKNLPEEWTEEILLEKFNEFGVVTSHMWQEDKKGRHFAFINYEKTEEAKAAIEKYHELDLRSDAEKAEFPEGKPQEAPKEDGLIEADDHPEHLVYCQRAQSKAEREKVLKEKFNKGSSTTVGASGPSGVNLYVKNLADDVSDDALRKLFETFGEITSARIMSDDKGRSKGFGFVCYKTPDEATKAVAEMHLKTVGGKPLYVGLAEKKEERAGRLAARYKGAAGEPQQTGKGMYAAGPKGQGKGQMGPQMGPQMGQPMYFGGGMAGKGGPGGAPGGRPGMFPQGGNMMMGGMGGMGGGLMGAGGARMGGPAMGYPMQPMMGAPMMQGKGMPGQPGPMGGKGMQMGGPQMGGPRPGMPGPGGMQPVQRNEPLTAASLAQAPPGMQKQMLGEKLYPAVARLQPELAGKITGMMLEMDNSELLMMLESEQQLRQKVEEAMRVLNTMQGGQQR